MPTAVITGATRGIGKAITEKLLREKFDVAVCARSGNDLRELQNEWERSYPGRSIFVQAVDIQNKTEVNDFVRNIPVTFGQVDVLVNNAGIYFSGELATEPEGQLENLMATNLYGAYYLTRALLPPMKQRRSGHIFNICSVASLRAYPNGGAYSITKYALLGFSENLRYELRDEGVKVTAISPGAVWSDSWSGSGISADRMMGADDIADILWDSYRLSVRANVEHVILRPQLGDI